MGSCSSIHATAQHDETQEEPKAHSTRDHRHHSNATTISSSASPNNNHKRQTMSVDLLTGTSDNTFVVHDDHKEGGGGSNATTEEEQRRRRVSEIQHASSSPIVPHLNRHHTLPPLRQAEEGTMIALGIKVSDNNISGVVASPHHATSTNMASNTFLREVNSEDAFPEGDRGGGRGGAADGVHESSVRTAELSSPTVVMAQHQTPQQLQQEQQHQPMRQRRSSNPLQDSTNSNVVPALPPPTRANINSGTSQLDDIAAITPSSVTTTTTRGSYRRRRHTNISDPQQSRRGGRRRRHTAVSVGPPPTTVASGKVMDPSSFSSVAIRGSINPALLYPSDDEDCWHRDTSAVVGGSGGVVVEERGLVDGVHDEVAYEQHHRPAPPISLPHNHTPSPSLAAEAGGPRDALSQHSHHHPGVSLSTSSPTTGELFAASCASPSVLVPGGVGGAFLSGHASPDVLGGGNTLQKSNRSRPQPLDDPAAFQHVSSLMFVSGRLSLTTTEDAMAAYPLPHSPERGGGGWGPTTTTSSAGGHHHNGGARVSASSASGGANGSMSLLPHPPNQLPMSYSHVNVPPQPQQSFSASLSLFAGHRLSFESQSTRTDSSRPSQGSAVPPSIASTQIGVEGGDDSRNRIFGNGTTASGPHYSSSSSTTTTTTLNGHTAASSSSVSSPPQTNTAASSSSPTAAAATHHAAVTSLLLANALDHHHDGGGTMRRELLVDAIPPLLQRSIVDGGGDGHAGELAMSVHDEVNSDDDDDDSSRQHHERGGGGPAPIPSFCRP
ncbi:Hypothetical protein, putative [Bodo saltans]|uniref:Uncharacterized protein n=1 Tax=Bodo saltans TaxID=75058 RepID=A0A0S4JE16_BODSA|nr:Hypothetical protein, putative [Bodo saltans]|eukprot:CUG88403.1 Hypothetical protein, putative [Bodo saltans]